MRRPFGSVRARTSLGATVVVAIALVAAGIAVLMSLRSNLTGQADQQADSAARDIAVDIIAQVPNPVPYARLELPEGEDHPVQVSTRAGQLLAASEDLEAVSGTGLAAVKPVPAPVSTPPKTPAAFHDDGGKGSGSGKGKGSDDDGGGDDGDDDGGSGDDDPGGSDDDRTGLGSVGDVISHTSGRATVDGHSADYRFVTIEVTDRNNAKVLLRVGSSLAARQSALNTATTAMLVGLPALLLIVGGVTWLVTRRALAPVEGIRREMAAITASEDLSRRVPEPGRRDEVARLARTTNETLTALEASVERQRRFVADASHELRSPIASLRTQLEVGSAHPQLLDVPGAVLDTVRLQQLAADLLLLARLDAGERPAETRVDLGALVADEVAQRATDRVPVTVEAAAGLEVSGSRGQLARVLGNLLDNAQRHTKTEVRVRVRREAGDVVLAVGDDGAGVPESERQRIFERFVRLDEARGRDDGGAGLGLAIARDVALRHGGSLTVGPGPGGGALFELRLPLGR